jgi:hypothetical protein
VDRCASPTYTAFDHRENDGFDDEYLAAASA